MNIDTSMRTRNASRVTSVRVRTLLFAFASVVMGLLFSVMAPSSAFAEVTYPEPTVASSDAQASTKAPADITNLPAWRWPNVELDGDSGGFLGAFKAFPIMISTLLLSVSQFVWALLLGLMKFSLEAGSLIEPAAGPVNSAVASIGGYSVGLFFLFWAFVLYRVVRALAKGRTGEALRSGGVFLILFALLISIVQSSSAAVDSKTPLAKGTLPWFATQVAGFSGSIVGQLTNGRDLFTKDSKTTPSVANQGSSPTCEKYIDTLRARYEKGEGANPVLSSMSRLWEQTQYNSWTISTFGMARPGETNLGARSMCHWAEAVNGVSSAAQQSIAHEVTAGIPAPTDTVRSTVFGPYGKEDRRRAMTAWVACQYNSTTKKWETTPEFIGVWNDDPNGDSYGAKWCSAILASGASGQDKGKLWISAGEWDNFNLFGSRIADAFERENQTAAHREQIAAAKSWASGFSGANTSDRLLQGFLSLAVALFFMYALGFVAIGMFLAQLLLVVLLMFFPVTLLLFAIGSPKAKSMAKLTGTTMVSQAVFGLLLTVLIALSDLFQMIVTNLGAFAGAGFIKTLLYGLAPLMAFWCVRKLLQAAGMADILKPSGAVAFLASAAAVATGDKSIAKFAKADSKTGESALTAGLKRMPGIGKGLEKADGTAPLKRNWNEAGRAIRESKRLEEDATARKRIGGRLSKPEMTRLDKLNNWKDARSLSDDRLGSTLRRAAALGPLAVGALAAGPLALAGGLLSAGAATGAAALGIGAAGAAVLGGAGAGAYILGGKIRKDADLTVPVDAPNYISNAESAGTPELAIAQLIDELRKFPASATAQQEAFVQQLTSAVRSFQPVGTIQELSGARMNLAMAYGLTYDKIDVSPSGIGVPAYISKGEMRELPAEALRHFSYHLPEEDRAPRPGESPAERAERIMVIGATRGFVTPDGDLVDALSKLHSIELDSPEGMSEVQAWKNGSDHKTLGKRVAGGANSRLETQLVQTLQHMRAKNAQELLNVGAASAAAAYAELGSAVNDIDAIEISLNNALSSFDSLLTEQSGLANQVAAARADNNIKSAEELTAKIRSKGKEIESKFGEVRSHLVGLGEVNAELTVDTLLALQSFDDESQFTQAVLKEFEGVAEAIDKLEDLVPAAYGANTEAIDKLRTATRQRAASQTAEARRLASEAVGIKEGASAAAQQVAAVKRRNRSSRTLTTRELMSMAKAQEFPS